MARAKPKTVFVCEQCGTDTPKWEGRCPSCDSWNSLGEVRIPELNASSRRPRQWLGDPVHQIKELAAVSSERRSRLELPSAEVSRVLGGGVVRGSVILIAGEPGIGKSTLLLQMADDIASKKSPVLYVSGEESAAQVKLRAGRLGISGENLFLLESTRLSQVFDELESMKPGLVLVDSIQTLYEDSVSSSSGSVAQIRECARMLIEWAKTHDIPVVLTGHVNKSGDVAGPRVLEHMVDTVLYIEGDTLSSWRLLKSVKNRFGSTNELGVLEMTPKGLRDVIDPSRAFLTERRENVPGSVVVPTLEGSRPLLVEVQALTSPTVLPTPRRVANGIDSARLLLVCAVLTRRLGVSLSGQDVIVNVAGGLRIEETGVDLAVALAILSSHYGAAMPTATVVLGEVGLGGEIRGVPQFEHRLNEAARLGFSRCVAPQSTIGVDKNGGIKSMEILTAASLGDAIRLVLPDLQIGG